MEKGKHCCKFHPVNHGEVVVQIKRVCFRKGALGFLSLCTEENIAQPGPHSQWKHTWPGQLARLGLQPAASLHRLQTKGEGMWLVQSWLALLSSLPAQSKGAYGHYWGVSGKSDALICWVFPTVKISLSSFIGDAWLPHLTEQMLYLL